MRLGSRFLCQRKQQSFRANAGLTPKLERSSSMGQLLRQLLETKLAPSSIQKSSDRNGTNFSLGYQQNLEIAPLVKMLCASGTKPGANNLNFRPIGKFPRGASNILPAGAEKLRRPSHQCLPLCVSCWTHNFAKQGPLSRAT